MAVLVIIVFCIPPVMAQENYTLSAIPQFGIFYGQAEEIVYPPPSTYPLKGNRDYLSQLLWEMKPVFYYGLDLDFSRVQPMDRIGFYSVLSLKTAIPGKSGNMEDRDWQSKVNNALTNYSVHDNFTEEIFWLDASLGLSLPIRHLFLLKMQLCYSYMRFCFYGMDGYMIYAKEISSGVFEPIGDAPVVSLNGFGKVISYTQEWFIFSPGFSFGMDFLKYFYFELFFQISPVILFVDIDDHLMTKVQYKDYLMGGVFLEPRAAISFTPNKWLSVSFETSYRGIFLTRGATYKRNILPDDNPLNTESYYVQLGEAGAGLSIISFRLLLKIRLTEPFNTKKTESYSYPLMNRSYK